MSQCYIRANLVKIHPPVHEILCKQESATLTPTLSRRRQDPHQKQYVRLPFGGGHKKSFDSGLFYPYLVKIESKEYCCKCLETAFKSEEFRMKILAVFAAAEE